MRTTEPITADKIEATPECLKIHLPGRLVSIAWDDCPPALRAATPPQRCNAKLSPGGYGIHWPDLDEDLSIQGLIERSGDATGESL